jgi:hypothetical protein
VKSVTLNLILIVLIALFSLPLIALLLALYVFVFFGLGGGWAYAGSNGCHFVIGPIGYAMLSVPGFAACAGAWKLFRKLRHRT